MSKPTAEVTNRYHKKAYDRVNLLIPKGRLQDIKDYAKANNTSVNNIANEHFKNLLGMTEEQWKQRDAGTTNKAEADDSTV